jgi:hypothetical protein
MPQMRAKMKLNSVLVTEYGENLSFQAVCQDQPYTGDGSSEDNTYALFTPNGNLSLLVNNPALLGQFKPGQTYYLDFSEVG